VTTETLQIPLIVAPPPSLQVTFLPLLTEPCSFDLLIYTDKKAIVPKKWEDSDPRYIMNSQEVKLRSFTTSVREYQKTEWMREAHFSPQNTTSTLAQQ
jgi:hypothetical protein